MIFAFAAYDASTAIVSLHPCLLLYPSLWQIISPFGAFKRKRNSFFSSKNISNFGSFSILFSLFQQNNTERSTTPHMNTLPAAIASPTVIFIVKVTECSAWVKYFSISEFRRIPHAQILLLTKSIFFTRVPLLS